jgi:hypothetical protein
VNIWSASTALYLKINLKQLALIRVHRGVEQLFRVHFAQAFEAFDLHTAAADLDDLLVDLGDREERVRDRSFAFAFDELEDWLITRGVVIDLQATTAQVGDQLLNCRCFVQLDLFCASPDTGWFSYRRSRSQRQ